MASTEDYTGLVPNQNTEQPNFMAALTELVRGVVEASNLNNSLITEFDIDTATGAQLDQVGLWAGVTRYLGSAIPPNYFAWDTVSVGWDSGEWYEDGMPSGSSTVLTDAPFRVLIKSKIGANQWDGTTPQLQAIMARVFTGTATYVFAVDEQNMTMTVALSGALPNNTELALLTKGYLVPKPAAVHINYITTTVSGAPLFGFDVENQYIAGWDVGAIGLET